MLAGLLIGCLSVTVAGAAPNQIAWQPSLDQALEQAARDGKPVFLAINMDGERANDEVIREHYKDRQLIRLAGLTAPLFASKHDHASQANPCSRCGVVTCEQHMRIEKEMRKRFLQSQADAVIAPQHLWIGPDGKLLLSVPYRISKGELEWCFVAALRALKPGFQWTLSGSARAPRRLVMGDVTSTGLDPSQPPPTKQEVAEIVETLRKAGRPWQQRDQISRLMLSTEKKALEYIQILLSARSGGRGGRGGGAGGGAGGGGAGGEGGGAGAGGGWKTGLVHEIGRNSPAEYWSLLTPLLSDNEIEIRREVAVALEQLAAPKALGDLIKRLHSEKEVAVQGELLRAIGSCGGASPKAMKLLQNTAQKDPKELLRINATVAVAALEDRELVLDLARSGLLAEVPGVRVAASYVIAIRRESSLKANLEEALQGESDDSVKSALERSLAVLNGADSAQLDPLLREFTGSDILRDRP